MKKSFWLLIVVCSLYVLSGCGSAPTTTPPPVATHYSVTSGTTAPVAGIAFNITITALDVNNSAAATYSGAVHFTSSDAQAVLPASTTITNGTGSASVTLKTAGPQTITATGSINGTSGTIPVGPAAASSLSVSAAAGTVNTGTPFNFTVTAVDPFSNTATSYAGTVHFSSTDGSATLPADSKLTNGTGSFSATLRTSGSQTIKVTDTATASLTGTSFAISDSGPATHFSFNAQAAANTRRFIYIAINALDASNNTSNGYNGTVHFTSTDPAAILPATATFQNGSTGNLQFTMETPGNQTVTATDTVTPSIKGTSSAITVTAPPALAITSGAPPAGTVASSYGSTITIYEKCVLNPQTQQRTCTPCVPNDAGCGGSYPGCNHVGATAPVCVTSQTYAGFQIIGAGGVPPYTWTAASLPPGLSLTFTYPEELITGTPTPGSAATYNTMLTLSDSGMPPAPKTSLFPITINNPPPPVVSTSPAFPGATVNQPFSYTFSATAGLPPYQNWTEKGALPPGFTPFTSAGVLSGTPTMTGTSQIMVTVDDSLSQLSAAQAFNLVVYQHGFKPDGSMTTVRYQHTATLLEGGTVLLVGAPGLASAEKYNPGTGKFTPTKGSMSVDRDGHTATLLNTGKVLITGGTDVYNNNAALATAELFDPATEMFTTIPNHMSVARTGHKASLLADGKVLITGGNTLVAELFDPGTGMFTSTTGKMLTARTEDTATLLTNGKVLITGGLAGGIAGAALATAELYDPATESFSASAGPMVVARNYHTATLLTTGPNSGKVLIAGGNSKNAVAELYDPAVGSFSTTGTMGSTRQRHTATVLSDGTILMAGGSESDGNVDILAAAELFDPNGGTFTAIGGMLTPRIVHTATLLKDGTVLVTGGLNVSGTLATAELYQ